MGAMVQGAAAVMVALVVTGCCGPGYVVAMRPDDAPTVVARRYMDDAELYRVQGMEDAAIESLARAIEVNPRLPEAHIELGDRYREREQYGEAERAYAHAAALDPQSFDAVYHLALARHLRGAAGEATVIYARALAISPDDARAHRAVAAAHVQTGRIYEALRHAYRAVELEPAHQAGWSNLGAVYARLGDHEQAVEAYRRGATLGELAEGARLGLADAHVQVGRAEMAIAVLERVVQENPDSAAAHERLGYLRYRQRDVDAALAHYRQAVAIDGQDPAALNGVGVCLVTKWLQGGASDRAMRREAVEHWRVSLRLRPSQPRIVDLLGRYGRGM
ncbi:MAG: tetratricopeptide repeat protein [Phycisphaeraceae bacterium]